MQETLANAMVAMSSFGLLAWLGLAWLGGGFLFLFAIWKMSRLIMLLVSGKVSMQQLRRDQNRGLGL